VKQLANANQGEKGKQNWIVGIQNLTGFVIISTSTQAKANLNSINSRLLFLEKDVQTDIRYEIRLRGMCTFFIQTLFMKIVHLFVRRREIYS
jgi:hypothetical protein